MLWHLYSECGSWASSSPLPWGLAQKVDSQVPPETHWIRIYILGRSLWWVIYTVKCEKCCFKESLGRSLQGPLKPRAVTGRPEGLPGGLCSPRPGYHLPNFYKDTRAQVLERVPLSATAGAKCQLNTASAIVYHFPKYLESVLQVTDNSLEVGISTQVQPC